MESPLRTIPNITTGGTVAVHPSTEVPPILSLEDCLINPNYTRNFQTMSAEDARRATQRDADVDWYNFHLPLTEQSHQEKT